MNAPWPVGVALYLLLSGVCASAGSQAESNAAAQEQDAEPGRDGDTAETAAPAPAETSSERTELNLLGEVDAESGESRRNENVRLVLINNSVLQELNERMGATPTLHGEFEPDHGYFGSQYGGDLREPFRAAAAPSSGIHGRLFWTHSNSAFSARSFFQVGDVRPARTNDYGLAFSAPVWPGGSLSLAGSQRRLRGQVNGNVLVPAASERTPTATDPVIHAMVKRILGAFPDELPNRTDIDERALNTNAPQSIDNDRAEISLDQRIGQRDNLAASYSFTVQNVEAFQMVGGQNPDTTTRNHAAGLTWTRAVSPSALVDVSLGFDRVTSLLAPDETSLGTAFVFGRAIESIGPRSNIPIDRARNRYRAAAQASLTRRRHSLKLGFEAGRRQINGSETLRHRGLFSFSSDFGRDSIANFLEGMPSSYIGAVGETHRGFRDWKAHLYAGDQWRPSADLTVSIGLRYEPAPRPREVNNLTRFAYPSDYTNLGPSFGLAWRLPGDWGAVRAAYGLHYGEIFPATYMQQRFNPPDNITVSLNGPDLLDPYAALAAGDTRSELYDLAPDLRTPYVHLYNFTLDLSPAREWAVQLGYLGSRSHKLLTTWHRNRARPVEGIPLETGTINQRRPNPDHYTIYYVLNGSRGYYDAAVATLRAPRFAGFTVEGSYWLSKSIDLGADYTNTAFYTDSRQSRSPTEEGYQAEMRGLSNFDQRHATRWLVNYQTPALAGANRLFRALANSWELSSVVLLKSGTPFSVDAGSDAPGHGNVDGIGTDNPVLLDPSILGRAINHPDTSARDLPRSAFRTIEPAELRGNLGRNTFRKDDIANVNLAVARRWALSGDRYLLFRAESLNLMNHPQFAEPGTELSTENFAKITNTLNDGRAFQFTLEVGF